MLSHPSKQVLPLNLNDFSRGRTVDNKHTSDSTTSNDYILNEKMQIAGVDIHRTSLRRGDNMSSPYCFTASSSMGLPTGCNFLATQVWSSARVAAQALEDYADATWTICEFGCGPGLPSLTAAAMGCKKVYATDIDEFALGLVCSAATEQGLRNVESRKFDLLDGSVETTGWFKNVDLVVLSDVFESNMVAKAAAQVSKSCMEMGAKVWVFAQSDRAQRDAFLTELGEGAELSFHSAGPSPENQLWLCDVDETKVKYG